MRRLFIVGLHGRDTHRTKRSPKEKRWVQQQNVIKAQCRSHFPRERTYLMDERRVEMGQILSVSLEDGRDQKAESDGEMP
jgi:hypothetical protein